MFFTRWWISRIVASLDNSARSRRLTSVTSRVSSNAPSDAPRAMSGSVRINTAAPPASTSIRMLGPPASTSRMCAASSWPSKGSEISGFVTSIRLWPCRSLAKPMR
ncbi:Uncharacterised protein [Mycobacteroides abscessus subsp. abscessus]|nr:Uncharacterised protein [Mycobacteroides abscessus subsp. abscessus]